MAVWFTRGGGQPACLSKPDLGAFWSLKMGDFRTAENHKQLMIFPKGGDVSQL